MKALKIESMRKSYKGENGERVAVDDLSLEVEEGEMLALLGTNGAGKTTTIKIATGITRPDNGSVSVFGIDLFAEPLKAKAYINASPQETAIAPALSVEENLKFIAKLYGQSKADADKNTQKVMGELGIADRARDRAGKLSGGLKRRLSIAMALITEPKLLFLDEPTLGLDVIARRELWHYIKSFKGKTAIVLTTHYLEEAEALADNIAIMHCGKLKAYGSAEEIIKAEGVATFEDAFLKIATKGVTATQGEMANE